jgi:hypothetical protein
VLCGAAVLSALLLSAHSANHPELHLILDTGLTVLSGVLALFFWNVGGRSRQYFSLWIAAALGVTWVLDAVHLAITATCSSPSSGNSGSWNQLLAATWGLPTYILPIGVGAAVWLLHRNSTVRPYKFGLALLALSGGIAAGSLLLPSYVPGWPGVVPPALVLTPVLWVLVGAFCWRWR